MDAFTTLNGLVAPLDRANVDTDQIIPKQYLKSIKRTGFCDYLYDAWRFLYQDHRHDAQRAPDQPRFLAESARISGRLILIARDNFGCGSSREHAVWALKEFGFRAVLAPSFADIFFGNCFKNGVLPIALPEEVIDDLFKRVATGLILSIDLRTQTLMDGEHVHNFEIDPALKEKMLTGMDDIDLTLAEAELIRSFEAGHRQRQPWLFRG